MVRIFSFGERWNVPFNSATAFWRMRFIENTKSAMDKTYNSIALANSAMERIPLHSWEIEFSIQYNVTINSQLNDRSEFNKVLYNNVYFPNRFDIFLQMANHMRDSNSEPIIKCGSGIWTDVTRVSSFSPLVCFPSQRFRLAKSVWNQGNVRVQALAKKNFHLAKTYFSVLQHIVLNLNLVKNQLRKSSKCLE
jgi:hypothetical protein